MSWLLTILFLLLLAGLLSLASQPNGYRIKRCIQIEQPPETVFNQITDLPSWKAWSPWLMHEPSAKLTYSDAPNTVGGAYSWQGEKIGSGTLTHVSLQSPDQIRQRIEFIQPFKSSADILWEFKPVEQGCEVCWTMQGQLPFLFRFLHKKMTVMIGNDFELGLALLKGQLEEQASYPRIQFEGEVTLAEKHGLHYHFAADMEAMQQQMETQFPALLAEVEQQGYQMDGMPATIYHQSKPKIAPTWFEVDLFLPVKDAAQAATIKRNGGKYLQVSLLGDYEFLKLAWHSAFAQLQMSKHRLDRQRPPFEEYHNNPHEVEHPNQLKTVIFIPIK